jgi:diguanylate cyclase (GGDEF)-like protein/PAS domain S-box-containing protein
MDRRRLAGAVPPQPHPDPSAHDAALRRRQAPLVRLDEEHRVLFDHVQAGIVVHAATTEILFANARAAELLGVSEQEALGAVNSDPRWAFVREDGSLMPIEEYPVNLAVSSRSVLTDYVIGNQRVSDGKLVWLMCNAYPLLDADGVPQQVVVSFTDVTDLKQAERALQKSEERLRLVLLGANDAAWDWDLQTQELYYSPRWWQMLGHEVDALPNDQDLWRRLTHPEDQGRVMAMLEETLAGQDNGYEVEFRLRHDDGHWVPVLSRGYILRDAAGRPVRISGTNTDLTERKRTEEQIHQLAYFDALTGLPNRRRLLELLQQATAAGARNQTRGALLFIDLDNFKTLNDTRGHHVGDLLLEQVAERLRHSVRDRDVVARLGGDEFVVVLEDVGGNLREAAVQARAVAESVVERLRRPYEIAGLAYSGTVSIGIALCELGGHGVEDVLKQADLAMYQAKAAGRDTFRFFDPTMQVAVDEQLELEAALRHAVSNDELVLHLQPQVDASGSVTGVEALVRWQHPSRGLVPPAAFVPLAESTGLILPLGRWVLRHACHVLARWAADPRLAHLTLSVNVSVRQFWEEGFVDDVLLAVEESGADPHRLKLELTESLFARSVDGIIDRMHRLRAHGIAFSLDDFGTGYSSLSYLQRMPLDEIKIDRSFVEDVLTNPNDATIARVIVSLAHNLGLAVVAEGVETEEQHRFLREQGCGAYQGYLFGRPVPVAELEATLRADPPA